MTIISKLTAAFAVVLFAMLAAAPLPAEGQDVTLSLCVVDRIGTCRSVSPSFTEGFDSVTLVARRHTGVGKNVRIEVEGVSFGADGRNDLSFSSYSIGLTERPGGTTTASVRFVPREDYQREGVETFEIRGYSRDWDSPPFTDEEPTNILTFTVADFPVDELDITLSPSRTTITEGDDFRITARSDRRVPEDVYITLRKIGGEANILDYEVDELRIRRRSTSGSTTLSTFSDTETEGTETLSLQGHWSRFGVTNRLDVIIEDGGGTDDPDPPVDSAADRAILEAFHGATGGANWNNNANWNTDRPLSEWYGVTVGGDAPRDADNHEVRVTGLSLPDNNLTGEIPRELAGLLLETLVLNGNNLAGTIPEELRRFEGTINPQQGGVNLPVGTPVPALPFVGALLLACGLYVMGRRKMPRPH